MVKFDDKNHWDWTGENYEGESIIQCDTYSTLVEHIYNDNVAEKLIEEGWNKIAHYADGSIVTYAEITLDEHKTINFSSLHRVKPSSKTLKEKVLNLIKDIDCDSKKKSEKARDEIIKICEPIVEKFYNIASKYSINGKVGWPEEYSDRFGSICDVEGLCDNGTAIELYYEDSYYSEVHGCYVHMPLSWFDDGEEEKYESFCKAKALNSLEAEIKEHERIIELRKEEMRKIEEL